MNWFERYGIPGTYFYIILLSGLYALYPCRMAKMDPRALAAFAVSFLPIGYIISIIGQWVYLHFKCCGLHRKAAEHCGITSIAGKCLDSTTESELEVLSCLNAIDAENVLNGADDYKVFLDKQRFIQEWIRKRMDVLMINHSLQIATVLVFFMTLLLGPALWRFGWQPNYYLIPLLIVILGGVITITCFTNSILKGQIVRIISGCWRELGFEKLGLRLNRPPGGQTPSGTTPAGN